MSTANISYNPPYQIPVGGSVTYTGGTGGMLISGARDILDARRMMDTGRVPTAQYPDGYLGTIESRRGDRLMNRVGTRQNQRSYQRGVHKGERIDPADYYWPDDFNPSTGLEFEARGERWTAQGSMIGSPLVNDGKSASALSQDRFATAARVYTQEITPPYTNVDEQRRAQLQRFRPAWR
ncbi:hypothetical protein [Streptomyces sp. CBMA29]|uniref:hypothetical protein n=1 Tax=Streptomyces sp. CBMA29 TaxID=1896314 RepID=UPI001661F93B|nr:hypothetical protein [Streptomyces sp. CBMA29]